MATTSILVCHILQYYNNFLAWWFNAGVDVFLILSGYLYGIRSYSFTSLKECFYFCLKFYLKVFIKLLVPYYLLLALMIPAYLVMGKIDFGQIMRLCLFINPGVQGFGHVWYFIVIIICYLVTPFWYFIPETKWKVFLLPCAILILMPFCGGNKIWYVCYLLGILIARTRKLGKTRVVFDAVTIFLGLLFSVVCIYTCVERTEWNILLNVQKLFMGGGIVILCMFFKGNCFNLIAKKILNISDALSYKVFLIHPFFLSGALCLMKIFERTWQNVVLCLTTTLVWSIVLHFSSEKIKLFFLKRERDKSKECL